MDEARMIERRYRMRILLIVLFVSLAAWLSVRWLADSFDRPYARVEAGLYIGRAVDRPPRGTTAVVNLCGRPDTYTVHTNLWAPVLETNEKPTLDWLQRVVEFIAEQRRVGRTTYVHCLAGMNRSGTAVTAFLMREHRWGRDEALTFLRQRRPEVQPNLDMMRLLDDWERKLYAEHAGGTLRR
jgi:hypothetical protein